MNTNIETTETTVAAEPTETALDLMPEGCTAIADSVEAGFTGVLMDNIIAEAFSGDLTTDFGKEAYFKCLTDCDAKLSEMINKRIFVRDVYTAKVRAAVKDDNGKPTGETKVLTRIVLIDTDGNTYTCSSVGVANSIAAIIRMCGKPSWVNGLPLMVKQKNLANGNSILTVVYSPVK